jgi:hypothetical protein
MKASNRRRRAALTYLRRHRARYGRDSFDYPAPWAALYLELGVPPRVRRWRGTYLPGFRHL